MDVNKLISDFTIHIIVHYNLFKYKFEILMYLTVVLSAFESLKTFE